MFECSIADGRCITLAIAGYPQQLAVDSDYVYWADTAGSIGKCPIGKPCGTSPIIVAKNQRAPYGIAVDSNRVYWTNFDTGGSVMSVAK